MKQKTKTIQAVQRLSPEIESKVLTKLSKLLEYSEESISEEEATRLVDVGVMDCASVCMIIPTTVIAKRLLARFIPADEDLQRHGWKAPKLDYKAKKEEIKARFSIEYLEKALSILKASTEGSIKLSLRNDYPLSLENEHFRIVLAPRVEND